MNLQKIKSFKKYFNTLLIFFFLLGYSFASEVKILKRINNEIITNIDVEIEYNYLIALNNDLKKISKDEGLKIAEESGTVFRNTVLIENFATQKDLSDMVGASRETVNTTLKSLEKDDMISRDGKSLIINDFSKFQKRYN